MRISVFFNHDVYFYAHQCKCGMNATQAAHSGNGLKRGYIWLSKIYCKFFFLKDSTENKIISKLYINQTK